MLTNVIKQSLAQPGAEKKRHRMEYDSDEEVDDEGTWEHKRRIAEMEQTYRRAQELTEGSRGKHHLGDFLPPDVLESFFSKWEAIKDGTQDSRSKSDFEQFKLQSDNIGFKMLEKMGWKSGEGLGSVGQGIAEPISRGQTAAANTGLGSDRPEELSKEDDEFAAYRKRMMIAYRFRPNPLVSVFYTCFSVT